MSAPVPNCEPSEFVAGDTVHWTKSLPDYSPLDGWTLSYRVIGKSDGDEVDAGDIDVVANGGGWDITIPASASEFLGPGVHTLFGCVTNAATGERRTTHRAEIRVGPNLAIMSIGDLLTDSEKQLAVARARYAARLAADQETVMVNGTSLTRIPIEKLRGEVTRLEAKVWAEKNPDTSNPRHVVRFGRVR